MSAPIRVPLHIGGKDLAAGGGSYDVVDPSTEKVFGFAPEASVADVQQAIDAANTAFPAWAATPPAEKARLFRNWAEAVDDNRDRLIEWQIAEMGGTRNGAPSRTVMACGDFLRSFAERAFLDLGESFAPRPGFGGMLSGVARRKPVGVISVLTPYNAALLNIASMAGPALLTGNTVVVKPAPQDPLTALEVIRLATEAGFPPGVVNSLGGWDAEIGREMVRNPGVRGIGFTGSPKVGVEIAQVAGGQLKKMLLELGGKGACVVLDDAGLDIAVDILSSTWLFHSGQACGSPTRAIVHESLKDELVRRLVAVADSAVIGPTHDPASTVGPVISAAQRDRIEGYVASALEEGATLACGGSRPDVTPGFYAAPTLLTDCQPTMRAVREEIFGPVITMLTVADDDEAVAVANDSDYGLVNYVVSRNTNRAFALANRLESGVVSINTLQSAGNGIEEMPFGGRKLSGFGRKGGTHAMLAFTDPQGIVVKS